MPGRLTLICVRRYLPSILCWSMCRRTDSTCCSPYDTVERVAVVVTPLLPAWQYTLRAVVNPAWLINRRCPFGLETDGRSSRSASDRRFPSLGRRAGVCWPRTIAESRRAPRRGRGMDQSGSSMRPFRQAWRTSRLRRAQKTVRAARRPLRAVCCDPSRWRRGDRPAPAALARHSRPGRNTPALHARARMRAPGAG